MENEGKSVRQWSGYYKDRVGSGYAKYACERYDPFVRELLSKGRSFREEGCGIGTIAKILLWLKPRIDITVCDIDEYMLELASQNLGDMLLPARISRFDARTDYAPNDSVDVVFSHGLLEHFSDEGIRSILQRQLITARDKVVHYVPTDRYNTASFGDERLLPVDYWLKTWKPTRYELFNEDMDLIIVWEKPKARTAVPQWHRLCSLVGNWK